MSTDHPTHAYLAIDGLTVGYGGAVVLDGLSLGVGRGELVALLGSSGCGKTTLLRAIAGFIPAAGGSIRVAERDITRVPPERRNTAMVFQSYALWPHMSVAGNIGYGLKLRRWPRARIAARVEEMLALVELGGLGGRRVGDLSGGQRQRVALARALAVDPELLLLDEPLSNLDARIRLDLRHEIRALQQRLGITAVHVTHDREEAMVMADRIVILDRGVIAQVGSPYEVYHRPASPFVARFMGAGNRIEFDAAVEPGPDGAVLAVAAGADHGAARLPTALAPGAPGRFAAHFRSDEIHLIAAGTADAPGALTLRGRIAQASYPGGVWRYAVAVGGATVQVDAREHVAVGDPVGIAVPAASLHLFPAAGTGAGDPA